MNANERHALFRFDGEIRIHGNGARSTHDATLLLAPSLIQDGMKYALIGLAVVGCTATPSPVPRSTPPPTLAPSAASGSVSPSPTVIASASSKVPPSRASGRCRVDDVRTAVDLVVTPPGAPAFGLHVAKGVPLHVTIDPDVGNRWPVEVGGPVEVHGELDVERSHDSPVLVLARDVVYGKNFVRIHGGHPFEVKELKGDEVRGDAHLGDLEIRNIIAPCNILALDGETRTPPRPNVDVASTGNVAKTSFARMGAVTICEQPDGPRCVAVDTAFPLVPIKGSGGDVEVRTVFTDGSELHGWTKRADLVENDLREPAPTGRGGGCECKTSSSGRNRKTPPDPREHYGEARLAVGARIVTNADGTGEWGVVRTPLTVTIEMPPTADYGKITRIPGLSDQTGCDCTGFDGHAFVSRASVTPIR